MKKEIQMGEIAYHLFTERTNEGYFGLWACSDGESGGSNHVDTSEENALSAAEHNARQRHLFQYNQKPNPEMNDLLKQLGIKRDDGDRT